MFVYCVVVLSTLVVNKDEYIRERRISFVAGVVAHASEDREAITLSARC